MTRAFVVLLYVLAIALMPACAADPKPVAPDYEARRLGSEEKVSLGSLRGQVVLLNVWATWCGPCREEMPDFERLYGRYRDRGLRIIGVNIDEGQGDSSVEQVVRGLGVSFDIWRDPEDRFQKRFRTLGVPETLLLDRNGETVRHWRGRMDPNAAENLESIHKALGLPAADAQQTGAPDSTTDPVQAGRRLADQRDCLRCHSLDGTPLEGPSFKGVAGTKVRLADGRTVVRDGAYLARAISDPDAEIVAGFRPGLMTGAMPGRTLTSSEVDALVAFIASLSAAR
jgi:cytochrome c-type biogenesis protein